MVFGVAFALIFVVAAWGATPELEMAETRASYLQHQAQHARADVIAAVNGPYSAPDAPYHVHRPRPMVDTGGVDQWRTLAGVWFPPDKVDDALAIIWCESQGNPDATNPVSSASGLWQFLRGWYAGRWSSEVGVFDPFDPAEAMRAAVIVSDNGTNWGDWSASRHCHGL